MLGKTMRQETSIQVFNENFDDFASNLQLFENMESKLRGHLQKMPNNEALLNQLAICSRKQGKLQDAIHYYAKLSALHPENANYRYAIAALTGNLGGNIPDDIDQPNLCPFFEWSNFLPESTIQTMIDFVQKYQANFHPSLVDSGDYKPKARNSMSLKLKGSPVRKKIRDLIIERYPEITLRLGLKPFDLVQTEVKLVAYHNNEYFRTHQDGGTGRLISYTYFFHPEPKRFSGGEFVAFDTDKSSSTFDSTFTRIIPKRNSAFFFPSHYYHAVLPVITQNNDFMSARFVIIGHLSERIPHE